MQNLIRGSSLHAGLAGRGGLSLWRLVWGLVILAAGCSVTQLPPSPTQTPIVSGLASQTRAGSPTRTLPPTFTPLPSASFTPTPLPTATPTPSRRPTSTATPTPTPCAELTGRVVTGTFPSLIQGLDPRYRVYLPPCYGQYDRLYPALYLFHGNIYTESHWDDLGIDEAADAGIAGGELPPFVIVLPFGGEIANNSSGGDGSFEGVVLHELIPFIEGHYCVWPEAAGRAIGGLSRGGYWSLEIGFRHPGLFASVAGHSAAIFEDNAGPVFNPLSTGVDPRLIGLPIYLDIGDRDWLRQGVFDLHGVMVGAGIPHVWQLNPGSHEAAYWSEHIPEYLAWYASHWPAAIDAYPSAEGRTCLP